MRSRSSPPPAPAPPELGIHIRQAARALVEALTAAGAIPGSGSLTEKAVIEAAHVAFDAYDLGALVVVLMVPATMTRLAEAVRARFPPQRAKPGTKPVRLAPISCAVQTVPLLGSLDPSPWFVAVRPAVALRPC